MKKDYFKPCIKVVEVDATSIICTSPGGDDKPFVSFGDPLDDTEYEGD